MQPNKLLFHALISFAVFSLATSAVADTITINGEENDVHRMIYCEAHEQANISFSLELMVMTSSSSRPKLGLSISSIGNLGEQHEVTWHADDNNDYLSDAAIGEEIIVVEDGHISGETVLESYPVGDEKIKIAFDIELPNTRTACR